MKKLLKILTIAVAVVIVLFIAAAVVLTVVVDPNRYRDDIIKVVKEQTGRDLKIDGKLSLSFFPWLGLETKRLEVSNARGFGKEPFAVIDSTETKVKLLPLFRGQVVVGAVRLNGLKVHLARNAKGETNWDDLTKRPAEKPAAKPTPKKEGGAGAALAAFTIDTFQIRNSEFTWRDDAAKQQYAVRGLDLTSGNVVGSVPAPFKLAFNLESSSPPIKERVELVSKLSFDPEQEKLNIPELTLSLGDLRVNAQATVSKVLSEPAAVGKIDIPAFDARALLGRLGIDYQPADANAMRKVGVSTKVAYDALASTLSDLTLTLDNTRITGDLAVRNHPGTAYRFNLAVDNINVDQYLPAAQKSATAKSQSSKAEPIVIPLALLRGTDANGSLRIGKLQAFGIHSQDVSLKVAARNGRIVLGPNAAKLYGGNYSGRTAVDASGKVPQFRFDERIVGVQLAPFLKDAQLFDKFSGNGNVVLALTAQGLDAEQIKRTLSGSVSVSVKEGAIEGIDLEKTEAKIKEIRSQSGGDAKKILASLPSIKPDKGDKTTFTKLQANAALTNGVVNNKDLAIEAPHLRVNGTGTVNLVTETFDNYLLRIGDFPLIVSGKFDSPKFRPDWNAIYRAKTEQKVEQKKEEVKQELRDKVRDKAKSLLDRLRR